MQNMPYKQSGFVGPPATGDVLLDQIPEAGRDLGVRVRWRGCAGPAAGTSREAKAARPWRLLRWRSNGIDT